MELFGHWWYEGPEFLNFLLRKLHFDQEEGKIYEPLKMLEVKQNLSLHQMNQWI